ncbi:hypothetical protein KAR48_09190 [bacterium]|nr:hypothetical protein [bacterium]
MNDKLKQMELDQAVKYSKDYESYRSSFWTSIVNVNAILIGAFSVIVSINPNISKIHFAIFYIISFIPIGSICLSLYLKTDQSKNNMLKKIRAALGIIKPKESIPDGEKKYLNKLQTISIVFTILTAIYFIILISTTPQISQNAKNATMKIHAPIIKYPTNPIGRDSIINPNDSASSGVKLDIK